MYIHNLNPILFEIGGYGLRWYSLAYIFGILIGWWLAKILIDKKIQFKSGVDQKKFDNFLSYIIFGIIIGGRLGYVLFYNPSYYIKMPLDILKIWQGGMSFHGALIGIILVSIFFSIKEKVKSFILLDIVAIVSPIGIFFGRIANFINSELVGKVTNVPWGVVFPNIDLMLRHPSQIYEAIFEGVILFFILNKIIRRKNYKTGACACQFLILYGFFRVISEYFREPDIQIGYLFGLISMGSLLSFLMIIFGLIIFIYNRNKNES